MRVLAANRKDKLIPSLLFEEEILGKFPKWLAALQAMKAEPPVVFMMSLLNIQGYTMALRSGWSPDVARRIKREHLYMPGTVIENLNMDTELRENPDNIFDVLRPHFDVFWNACGFARSIFFDAEGNPLHRQLS